MAPADRIRVLCVDDHRIVRDGIGLIVGREPDMEVVGLAASGQEAVDLFFRHRPDVTLMDLQLKGMSGVEAIRTIRRSDANARIVVLTMYQGDEDIYCALQAGAATYLLKDALSEELIDVVRDVALGKPLAIRPDIQALFEERRRRPELTPRELEILNHIADGMPNKQIASLLGISETTTEVHVKHILEKLDVSRRTEAVSVALRRGIIRRV